MEKAGKRLGIVGPDAAGKSTLITNLKKRHISAHHIAQEHSFVPEMWEVVSHPDILIYLDVSFDVSSNRREQNWSYNDYSEQVTRLRHAREHAQLYINTDHITPEEVLEQVLTYLVQTEHY